MRLRSGRGDPTGPSDEQKGLCVCRTVGAGECSEARRRGQVKESLVVHAKMFGLSQWQGEATTGSLKLGRDMDKSAFLNINSVCH